MSRIACHCLIVQAAVFIEQAVVSQRRPQCLAVPVAISYSFLLLLIEKASV